MILAGSDGAGTSRLDIGAGGPFNFTSTNTPSGSAPGISRSAAGVLQINTTSKNGLGSLLLGGTGSTNSSTILDIRSTTKVLLLTRTASANIATPVGGMIIYDSSTNKFRGYVTSTGWVDLH